MKEVTQSDQDYSSTYRLYYEATDGLSKRIIYQ